MVRAVRAFLDFCYLVRQDELNEDTLTDIEAAVTQFKKERTVFEAVGVRDDFNLPRQHSITHYPALIPMFGALNGLCSSITESKHVKAVKEPYRRTSKFRALGQMVTINQRLDKLAALRVDFKARGMLDGPCLSPFASWMVDEIDGRDSEAAGSARPSRQSHEEASTGKVDEPSHRGTAQSRWGSEVQNDWEVDDGQESGPVDGEVTAEVVLARCPGMRGVVNEPV